MPGVSEEEYDIVPHKRVLDLQKDVEQIKRDPLASSPSGRQAISAMDKLSESMDKMVGLFEGAAERMKQEEAESEVIGKRLDPLMEKLDAVIDQNKKIATGIVAVADLIKEWMEKAKRDEGAPLPPVRMPQRVSMPPPMQSQQMSIPPAGTPVVQFGMPPMDSKEDIENRMMGPLMDRPMPPPPGMQKSAPFPPLGGPMSGPPPGPTGAPVPSFGPPPPSFGVRPPERGSRKKNLFGF